MLVNAGLDDSNWQLIMYEDEILIEPDRFPEITILAIICHQMQQLPIYFRGDNLNEFRKNMALSLCRDKIFMF